MSKALRPLWGIVYFIGLVYYIFMSSCNVFIDCIKGRIDPQVMEIDTVLKRPVSMSILANSITLTPGTLTIDVFPEKQKLLVAVITPRSQKDVIPFEGWIKKMVED